MAFSFQEVKLNHIYLYSALHNTDCVKTQLQTNKRENNSVDIAEFLMKQIQFQL